jgi:hypothetical protein
VTRPPLPLLVAYRLVGWRLGPEYRAWTYDDITRRGWELRQVVPVGLLLGALLALLYQLSGANPQRAITPLAGVLVLTVFLRRALRERALRQQGLDLQGEPDAPWFDDEAARHKRNVNGALTTLALVVAGSLLLGGGLRR